MSHKSNSSALFFVDELPKGILTLDIGDNTFLLEDSLSGEAEHGLLYEKYHNKVYYLDDSTRVETFSELSKFQDEAYSKNQTLLRFKVYDAVTRQAGLTIYEVQNEELKGRAAILVDLREGHSFKDIRWLPEFYYSEDVFDYSENAFRGIKEFNILKFLYAELDSLHKAERLMNSLQSQEISDDELEVDDYEPQQKAGNGATVYTVELEGVDISPILMATSDRNQALLYGETQVTRYEDTLIKTWVDGKHTKTVRLEER